MKRAFTMIEMLVTIAITAVLVVSLVPIINAVQQAAGADRDLSDINRSSQSFKETLSVHNGVSVSTIHYLAITNHQIPGVSLREGDTPETFRSDQLAMVVPRGISGPIDSVTPNTASDPSGTTNASWIRIWHGHVVKTDTSGQMAGDLGQSGPNQYASDWTFGRQITFLESSTHPSTRRQIYANSPLVSAPVTAPAGFTAGYSGPQTLSGALTDVAYDNPAASMLAQIGVPPAAVNTTTAMGYTYSNVRLHYRPGSTGDVSDGLWVEAQSIPSVFEGASEIIVEYAGDYPDVAGGTTDGKLDLNPDGSIRWYGLNDTPPDVLTTTNGQYNTKTALWVTGSKYLPKLIRVKTRIHGELAITAGQDGELGQPFEYMIHILD